MVPNGIAKEAEDPGKVGDAGTVRRPSNASPLHSISEDDATLKRNNRPLPKVGYL